MFRKGLVISGGVVLILLVSSIFLHHLLLRPAQALANNLQAEELTGPESGQDEMWSSSGPAGGYGARLAISTSNPDVLYAGSYGGVYRSTDGGVTWVRTTIHSSIFGCRSRRMTPWSFTPGRRMASTKPWMAAGYG